VRESHVKGNLRTCIVHLALLGRISKGKWGWCVISDVASCQDYTASENGVRVTCKRTRGIWGTPSFEAVSENFVRFLGVLYDVKKKHFLFEVMPGLLRCHYQHLNCCTTFIKVRYFRSSLELSAILIYIGNPVDVEPIVN